MQVMQPLTEISLLHKIAATMEISLTGIIHQHKVAL
jgi:hypothetical protein